MSPEEYQGLRETAKAQVKCGIYALEKEGYAELTCINLTKTQLKKHKRAYKAKGFRVLTNG